LVTGFAFKRVIDSMTRARWLSFRLAETLTLEDDGCAVLAWLVAGWFAGATLLLGFALLAAAGFDYLLGAPYRSAPARKKPAAVWFGLVRGRRRIVVWSDDGEGWPDLACGRCASLLTFGICADWPVVVSCRMLVGLTVRFAWSTLNRQKKEAPVPALPVDFAWTDSAPQTAPWTSHLTLVSCHSVPAPRRPFQSRWRRPS
jgi:hypothetical protein